MGSEDGSKSAASSVESTSKLTTSVLPTPSVTAGKATASNFKDFGHAAKRNAKGGSQSCSSSSEKNESQAEDEGETDQLFATNADIPDIIEFYAARKQAALDESDMGKPVFNNRCSRKHQLHNPLIIRRERIILNPKQAIVFTP